MKKKLLTVALAAVMVVSSAISALAVEAKEAITGDLTVTTFFNEKTDAVELKSGDSYTFKFNAKNETCSANYQTFVMAVTGAIGDAYTGADQEVLIVRGDNWGWGGKMSDFTAPDGAEGTNKLTFTCDVNWDEWQAAMKAGVDCEVTIARTGDKLSYTAKVGSWTMSTEATSGIALPESCYVFFTGESVVLSGITTTDNNASTDTTTAGSGSTETTTAGGTTTTTPDTGDSTMVLALVAVAVAAAVVVLKKRTVTE